MSDSQNHSYEPFLVSQKSSQAFTHELADWIISKVFDQIHSMNRSEQFTIDSLTKPIDSKWTGNRYCNADNCEIQVCFIHIRFK